MNFPSGGCCCLRGTRRWLQEVDWRRASYAEAPYRFEAGTPPIAQAIGLHAAIEFLEHLGAENIQRQTQLLAEELYQRTKESLPNLILHGPMPAATPATARHAPLRLAARPPSPRSCLFGSGSAAPAAAARTCLLSFSAADGRIHPFDVSTFLDIAGVAVRSGHHCTMPLHNSILKQPHGSVRASFALYHQPKDVRRFVKRLVEVVRTLEESSAASPRQ
eukprot:GHVT01002573.1.p1 GENE.GHVT01002573.1~~GHVT01002573.1.p1  ORF type:complete len:219 (+),score=55.58 GHVT01002573.1:124-780(+)